MSFLKINLGTSVSFKGNMEDETICKLSMYINQVCTTS